jgi:protease-4
MVCDGMPLLTRACVFVLSLLAASGASAQLHRATDPVATPASSLVLQDDALTIDINPAAIGQLQEWSAALLHSEVDQTASWLGRGDALFLATPVIGPLSLGFTVQSIRPGDRALRPFGAGDVDRAMAALGIAFAPSDRISVGLTTRTFFSGNARFDGLTAIDLGLLFRPSPWLSVGLVGRDLFTSRSGFGTAGLDLGSSVMLSTGLRPFGTDDVTLDLDLVSRTHDLDRIGARAGAVIALPYVGTAAGVIEAEDVGDADPALRVIAELAVQWGRFGAVGGGTGGDGFGGDLGWYGMVRADGRERPGIPRPVRVLDMELSGLTPRGMITVSLALDAALRDPRVGGVLLRPRDSGMGTAYAQELRLQIQSLRAAGKPVVCHLDSATGAEYYACSAADRVVIDPAGDVRLLGAGTSVVLFGETLRKIGVRADFIRIGPYKSAPEQFTQDAMGEPAREELGELLDDVQRRLLSDIANDLHVSQSRVAQIMDEGPQLAYAAVREGLVKATVDEHDIDRDREMFGGAPTIDRVLPAQSRSWGKQPTVGVIVVDDEIVDGDSVEIPVIDIHMTGGDTIIRELDAMAADPNIRAIVLRVDSPGGAALASDKMWRAVRRAREKKPVIASMGAIAASGGYYVACAADEIWADPSTLTGSIGIFYGKVDLEQLADKVGVHIETFRRGKRAGAESFYRPFTGDERAALADVLRTYYRMFISRVAEGRHMSVESVDAIARGRVYSGDAAQRLGLVDRLGGLGSAVARARQLADLPDDAAIEIRPLRRTRLLDYVMGPTFSAVLAGDTDADAQAATPPVKLSPQLRALVRAVTTLEQLGSGAPLALLPFDATF